MKKKAKFSNGVEIVYDERTGVAKLAQTSVNKQTQPLDVVEEQGRVEEGETRLDIPRDESVGLKQTHPKEVNVFKLDFEMGDNGSDTNLVPRSTDDGIGGKKVTFEEEKAKGYESGNSDDYVQTLQDRPMPKPSGDPQNHAVVANQEELMVRIAKLEKEVKEAKKEVKEAQKALNDEKLYRERERVIREILQVEAEKGLTNYTKAEADQIVEARIKHPVDILINDLNRVQSLPSASAASKTTVKSANNALKIGFETSGGLQSNAAALIPTNVPEGFPQNTKELYMATQNRATKINSIAQNLNKNTSLGGLFSDENIKDYEASKRRNY